MSDHARYGPLSRRRHENDVDILELSESTKQEQYMFSYAVTLRQEIRGKL